MQTKEEWAPVAGYNGKYEVSNLGRVRSFIQKKPRILTPVSRGNGYLKVILTKNKHRQGYAVHRLVAQAFIDNPSKKSQVNHINGNKHDNRATNLEWTSPSENIRHSIDIMKRHYPPLVPVQCVETGERFPSMASAERAYQLPLSSVHAALQNDNDTNGLHWKRLTS